MKQRCCYSRQAIDFGSLKVGAPDGSRVKVTYFYSWWNRLDETYTDHQAYEFCCVQTPLCGLFYRYRPSDDCLRYRPPRRKFVVLNVIVIFTMF